MTKKHKDTRPITDTIFLNKFLNKLKSEGEMGERNYTIFQVGKVTCLRVSDEFKKRIGSSPLAWVL